MTEVLHKKNNRHPLKTKSRFRLSFLNENTFNEVWTVRFTRTKVVIAIISIMIAIGCVIATIIVFSPVRTLLPGYLKENQRRENILNTIRLDSLTIKAGINDNYINNVKTILTSSDIPGDNSVVNPLTDAYTDSLLQASEAERNFIRQFEEREKFNLKVLSPMAAAGLTFYSPASMSRPIQDSESGLTTVNIPVPASSAVMAVHAGTVVDSYLSPTDGYVIIIQHPKGFVSRYSGLPSAIVKKGDKVSTGSAISLAGTSGEESSIMTFELWNNGTPLNPWKYIPF